MLTKRVADSVSYEIAVKNVRLTNEEATKIDFDFKKTNKNHMKVLRLVPNQNRNVGCLNRNESVMKAGFLWIALDEGRADTAALLVREGADLTVRKAENKRTIVHEVLRSSKIKDNVKREELAKLMLDFGADINARDADGYSLLHDALANNHCSAQLVNELLNRGVEVTISKEHSENDIFWAAVRKPELLPRLIKHQVTDEKTKIQRGAMAIHYLISKVDQTTGTVQTIKMILNQGVPVDSIDPLADKSRTLLISAFLYRRKDIVKFLLDYGAYPHQKNEFLEIPILQATALDYTDVIRSLIEKGVSIHTRNNDGRQPIHIACLRKSTRNINLFVSLGADLNALDNQGRTPFGYMQLKEKLLYNESYYVVIKYLALNTEKGIGISDKDMSKINRYDWTKNHFEKCKKELELMKNKFVYSDVSYFSLLTRDIKSMVQLMKNQDFVRSFKQSDTLFPEYSCMLLHSFEVSKKRLEVVLREERKLRAVFGEFTSDSVIDKIIKKSGVTLEKCKYDYYLALDASVKNTEDYEVIIL